MLLQAARQKYHRRDPRLLPSRARRCSGMMDVIFESQTAPQTHSQVGALASSKMPYTRPCAFPLAIVRSRWRSAGAADDIGRQWLVTQCGGHVSSRKTQAMSSNARVGTTHQEGFRGLAIAREAHQSGGRISSVFIDITKKCCYARPAAVL